MGIAYSVDGKLTSTHHRLSIDQHTINAYHPIEINKPVILRYRHLQLNWHQASSDLDKLLILTHVRTEASSKASSARLTYLNEKISDIAEDAEIYEISDFGAALSGHPLIHYMPAYSGETIRLTSRALELDKAPVALFNALRTTSTTLAGLPFLMEFAPFLAGASIGLSVIQKLINIFDNDDDLFEPQNLDLHFDTPNSPVLQSGRYVFAQDINTNELISGEYELSNENQLLKNGQLIKSTYIVIQANSEQHDDYKDFNYFHKAADIAALLNQKDQASESILALADAAKALQDIEYIREIKKLSRDVEQPENKARIKALSNSMSEESSLILDSWINQILKSN